MLYMLHNLKSNWQTKSLSRLLADTYGTKGTLPIEDHPNGPQHSASNEYFISFTFFIFETLTIARTIADLEQTRFTRQYHCLHMPVTVEKWLLTSDCWLLTVDYPHSTEYYSNMSKIFPIFHCKRNIVAKFLSNIAKYFITTLQF